ncbi:hypothetical protein LCGC14_0806800 [marine sediment metagenome]|uniref:Uncharacterized protein n=1 Tax=marine sediment metagenome TaxID=412755 RepID=A0A0F9SV90_9ZZZZ
MGENDFNEILSNPKKLEKTFLNEWKIQNESFFRGYYINDEIEEIGEKYYSLTKKYREYPFQFNVFRTINLKDHLRFIEKLQKILKF